MTPSIALVLSILFLAVLFFVKSWLRVDLVALLVLLSLTIFGLISHQQALSGFSNPAVITIASVLVLSAGLMRTGVANLVGKHVLRLAGNSEARLIVVMMTTVGLLSGFMNNIGVAALMLPVVLDIARRMKWPPSKLLMPLAFGSLLGGLLTLIGTSPNILISAIMTERGLEPFGFFDFTPIGLVALVGGILYMVVAGRHILPDRDPVRDTSPRNGLDLTGVYELQKVLFSLALPGDSALSGRTLADSRLGSALELTVLAISRKGEMLLAPRPGSVLVGGDKLLVEGNKDRLEALKEWKHLDFRPSQTLVSQVVPDALEAVEVTISSESSLIGQTLPEADIRRRWGVTVMAIVRDGKTHLHELLEMRLRASDTLLVLSEPEKLKLWLDEVQSPVFWVESSQEVFSKFNLDKQLLQVGVPRGSSLSGRKITDTRFGEAFGLMILGIGRNGRIRLAPDPDEQLRAGDVLLLQGLPENLETVTALQKLRVDEHHRPALEELESEQVGITEVMLSPRSSLVGKTLKELYFREKYGLTVLSVWRQGTAYHGKLRDLQVLFGDALLVYGDRRNLSLLAREPDFLVLTELDERTYKTEKAPIAAAIEVLVLLTVVVGLLPIYIAAPAGACLMVLTGCLNMDEVYRSIEWQAVILIAGMLSLGQALEDSGAASLIAQTILGNVAELGPLWVLAGLFAISVFAAQIMPTAAVPVLMAPIALSSAEELALSPHALMMAVAIACSSAFLSPVGHPVNLLVMGLGGYRFTDYTKTGLPLVILMALICILVLPLFWPLEV
jgi:di/tricarboxylate transporter